MLAFEMLEATDGLMLEIVPVSLKSTSVHCITDSGMGAVYRIDFLRIRRSFEFFISGAIHFYDTMD